jgi:hypothetical protein
MLAGALLWTIPAASQAQSETRTYTIHHAIFGDIGTLSDEITREGLKTRVVTRAEVRVAVLGITLHHFRARWSETWNEDVLKDYSATTTRNGDTISISGQHEDGKFVVRIKEREFVAPADVQPVHPWSSRFVRAGTLISPESGRIFPATIASKGEESLLVAGARHRVHHYVASFDTANHLYFDDDGMLLLAEYRDITGKVRLTLQSAGELAVASAE